MEFLSIDNQLMVYLKLGPTNSNTRSLPKHIHGQKPIRPYFLCEFWNLTFLIFQFLYVDAMLFECAKM